MMSCDSVVNQKLTAAPTIEFCVIVQGERMLQGGKHDS